MRKLALGVLDQSPVPDGSSPPDALARTVELAQACERLGYRRYWLAEHHNTTGLAGPAPEVMVATIASATSSIRVGAGGIMLPHYSPLKVAEIFHVLEALHPGRIDLGIGRAPGGDPLSAAALRVPTAHEEFPHQVQDLIGFLEDRLNPRHPFARVRAMPRTSGSPPVWLLGSSDYSAACAAVLGTSFSFAHFINPADGPAVVAEYRERFSPSPTLPQPRANEPVLGYMADFLWSEQRLIVEVDGFGFHSSRSAFEHDRRRDQRLAAAGYMVIRITWRQLEQEPLAVVARIAQALAGRTT